MPLLASVRRKLKLMKLVELILFTFRRRFRSDDVTHTYGS